MLVKECVLWLLFFGIDGVLVSAQHGLPLPAVRIRLAVGETRTKPQPLSPNAPLAFEIDLAKCALTFEIAFNLAFGNGNGDLRTGRAAAGAGDDGGRGRRRHRG